MLDCKSPPIVPRVCTPLLRWAEPFELGRAQFHVPHWKLSEGCDGLIGHQCGDVSGRRRTTDIILLLGDGSSLCSKMDSLILGVSHGSP